MTQRRSLIAFCSAIVLLGVLAAPAGAASNWTLRQLPPTTFGESQAFAPGLSGISCPTESLCVAAGSQNTLIVRSTVASHISRTSTSPTAYPRPASWRASAAPIPDEAPVMIDIARGSTEGSQPT
jgi:hypothetical protein